MFVSIGAGVEKSSFGIVGNTNFINSFQLGPETVPPPLFIGVLLLLPDQTPTAIDGV